MRTAIAKESKLNVIYLETFNLTRWHKRDKSSNRVMNQFMSFQPFQRCQRNFSYGNVLSDEAMTILSEFISQ